jgi:chorismate-pyruvate lyase
MSRIKGMTKLKISATVDPGRLSAARQVVGADRSVSEVLDLALDALVVRTLEARWLAAHDTERDDLPGEVVVDLRDVPWDGDGP